MNSGKSQTLAICFGQFGPYHHARVAALQRAAAEQGVRAVPVQIAGATTTYEWESVHGTAGLRDQKAKRLGGQTTNAVAVPPQAEDLKTLCEGIEETASPLEVFLKARQLFRYEKVDVAFLPSYSPARFFALFAAAKSLGIRTVMMNESHAGTEQATGWKRWIKRQIVKRFDAALVGGEPHKRHFSSLGIPADKIFTGYDAVDNDFFASRADDIRAEAQKSRQLAVASSQSEKDEEPESAEADGDSARRSQGQTKRQSVREAYGLPERYFLSLGRMVEKKNLATLIAAYAKYCDESRVASGESKRQEPVALVFVGSGELEGALREQARSLGLRVIDRTGLRFQETKRRKDEETKSLQKQSDDCKLTPDDSAAQRGAVYFYGFRQIEENPVFYALAEAFVLPSLKEEWGLVVNEAMAAGLPVIVSRTAGCAEDLVPKATASWSSKLAVSVGLKHQACLEDSAGSIQSGKGKKTDDLLEQRSNGFVFDPKSSDALSEALSRIADQKTTSQSDQETDGITETGQRSREIIAKFSCENFATQALRAAEAAF